MFVWWYITKIATPSWGGDFVLFVLLVLFEELGDEGGDFFCFVADAVVFAFDDGELWGGGGVGGEVLLATPEGYEAVVFAMEDEDGTLVGLGCSVKVELLGGEMVGEGDGHGKATLWAVDFELFAIEGCA